MEFNKIRELRKSQDITMKELGKILNLAESTISLYETNKRQPDYETLMKIASYFNVTVDYLIGNNNIQQHNEKQEDETNTIFIMGRNGKNRKIKLSEEEAEKLEKLLELTMPSVLDGDDF